MKLLKRLLAIFSCAVAVFCCVQLYQIENTSRKVKADRMELSHIKYGLFNVDEWKLRIASIITLKLNEFELTQENRPQLKKKVQEVLEKLISEVESVMNAQNKTRGLKGMLRGFAMDAFDVVDDVKKGIPKYADILLDYLDDPANREEIKKYLIARFNEFAENTAGEVDYREYNRILDFYHSADKQTCLTNMTILSNELRTEKECYVWILGFSISLFLGLLFINETYSSVELYLFVSLCISLLCVGVSLPMIDIEATISSFQFRLVGEEVSFTDQVLFFQSKSILEVVGLLFKRGEIPLMGVSVLIFSFSVLIPILKLVFSTLTFHRGKKPGTAIVNFLVFKSAKWSMADVMVVAIFMSFIGFNGVINSELTQLKKLSANVQIFTTNNSTLMMGFYLFTGYCLMGLLLATVIEKNLEKRTGVSHVP